MRCVLFSLAKQRECSNGCMIERTSRATAGGSEACADSVAAAALFSRLFLNAAVKTLAAERFAKALPDVRSAAGCPGISFWVWEGLACITASVYEAGALKYGGIL